MDVEYDEHINHPPTWAAPVWESITTLPKPTSDHVPFYSADPRWKTWEELDKIVVELGV